MFILYLHPTKTINGTNKTKRNNKYNNLLLSSSGFWSSVGDLGVFTGYVGIVCITEVWYEWCVVVGSIGIVDDIKADDDCKWCITVDDKPELSNVYVLGWLVADIIFEFIDGNSKEDWISTAMVEDNDTIDVIIGHSVLLLTHSPVAHL